MSIDSSSGSSSCVMVLVEDEGDISNSFITCSLLSLASMHSLLLMVLNLEVLTRLYPMDSSILNIYISPFFILGVSG